MQVTVTFRHIEPTDALRKYAEDKTGELVPVQAGGAQEQGEHEEHGEHGGGHGIHLPGPSYWPLIAAIGLPTIAYGVVYSWWWLSFIGLGVLLFGIYGWALEPGAE